ncbi:hypothetical protein C5167_021882 [Papaver somniferum]|uniref:Uncharacterized protein n=1 Tax=Papaver somniferum TaxID=3469 RepID=A0A4Y7JGB0_PAPSO|nr:hypothetical protein C5167_021882 [Papaver somniferum]
MQPCRDSIACLALAAMPPSCTLIAAESSDSDSIEEPESGQASAAIESIDENDPDKSSPSKAWQRIIRLDAVRTNRE